MKPKYRCVAARQVDAKRTVAEIRRQLRGPHLRKPLPELPGASKVHVCVVTHPVAMLGVLKSRDCVPKQVSDMDVIHKSLGERQLLVGRQIHGGVSIFAREKDAPGMLNELGPKDVREPESCGDFDHGVDVRCEAG